MNLFQRGIGFVKEVRQELTKVSWSTREELLSSTLVVITVTVIMAVFVGAIDLVLSGALRKLFG